MDDKRNFGEAPRLVVMSILGCPLSPFPGIGIVFGGYIFMGI